MVSFALMEECCAGVVRSVVGIECAALSWQSLGQRVTCCDPGQHGILVSQLFFCFVHSADPALRLWRVN